MIEILEYYPILITGTITTVQLTVMSAILALFISFVVGLARISRFLSVRIIATIYLEFFRFDEWFSDEKLLKKWQDDLLNSKAD